jgi:hypothetical protein
MKMKNQILNVLQILAVTTLLVAATMAKAEVYKCTGADGKTAFSDQPCATGQKAAVIKPQISSGATTGVTNSKDKAIPVSDWKSRPEYPECLQLKNRISAYLTGSAPINDKLLPAAREANIDITRYKEICGVIDKEGARELQEKRDREEKPQRDAQLKEEVAARCSELRNKLTELRNLKSAYANSTDRLTPQEELLRKKDIVEIERQTPLVAKEIEQSCTKK